MSWANITCCGYQWLSTSLRVFRLQDLSFLGCCRVCCTTQLFCTTRSSTSQSPRKVRNIPFSFKYLQDSKILELKIRWNTYPRVWASHHPHRRLSHIFPKLCQGLVLLSFFRFSYRNDHPYPLNSIIKSGQLHEFHWRSNGLQKVRYGLLGHRWFWCCKHLRSWSLWGMSF